MYSIYTNIRANVRLMYIHFDVSVIERNAVNSFLLIMRSIGVNFIVTSLKFDSCFIRHYYKSQFTIAKLWMTLYNNLETVTDCHCFTKNQNQFEEVNRRKLLYSYIKCIYLKKIFLQMWVYLKRRPFALLSKFIYYK